MSLSPDTFDLVLYGASGFTGQLVAEFLDQRAPKDLRWAMAGRGRGKLEALQGRLACRPAVVIADSGDEESIRKMVTRTKVVCSTVGPYSRYGTPVVTACARAGTDYCDLSGEIPWIARTIDAFHERAQEAGSRIVHSCGYDSIPFELGAYLTQITAREHFGVPCHSIVAGLVQSKGGLSGGTVASILEVLQEARANKQVAELLEDPICLQRGTGWRDRSARPGQRGVRHRPAFGWTAPHLMAVINVKIVRRSQSLLPDVFGAALDYDECVGFGPGLRGQAKARLMAVALKTAWFGLERRPIRSLLVRRLLPQPGHGPGEKAREAGHFHVLLRGFGKREGGRSFTVETDFKGAGDPGYAATSRMLGSVALCLATGQLEHPTRCGVLTPACSVGRSLPDFLRNSAFSIESRISEEK